MSKENNTEQKQEKDLPEAKTETQAPDAKAAADKAQTAEKGEADSAEKTDAKSEKSDTVSGDNDKKEGKSTSKGKKKRKKMSPRTKKRVILVGVIVGVLLVALVAALIVSAVIENLPPEFHTVRDRFCVLIEASYELNDAIFGAGLPVYKRLEREFSHYTVTFKEKTEKLGCYTFKDERYGTVVAYQYQIRRMEDKVNEDGYKIYSVYDVQTGNELTAYQESAQRFVQRTREMRDGYVFEQNGFYYYQLEQYENVLLLESAYYDGQEDANYDYVRFDNKYKDTDALKSAIAEVYSNAYVSSIYENLFTGVLYSQSGVMQALYVDYVDTDNDMSYLMKSNTEKWKPLPGRRFDLSTMRMIEEESNANSVTVELDSYLPGEQTRTPLRVRFARENGTWYLDSPTY